MKHNVMLTITSLLSILLFTFHLADDIVRGFEKGGVSNLTAVPIFVVWLYGTLVLAERRSGFVIILLFSLLGLAVPVLHMRGPGVGFGTTRSGGIFFVILSVRGLWSLPWRRRLQPKGLQKLQAPTSQTSGMP